MTADAPDLGADPRVVEAWVNGWALARETPLPVRDKGGFRVDVGWPQQRVRYVFPRVVAGVQQLANTIVDPWIFLKVCAPPEAMRGILTPRWVIQPPGFMMTCFGPMGASGASLPEGYTLDLREDLPVPLARVLTAHGEVAATGRIALAADFVIYDRIETHPDHRRRGRGRSLMKALEEIGRGRGKTQGLLVATANGRALYEALGWRIHSMYATAVIPGSAT
jgi:GNAT superfamily N-acetyltransferase